MSHIIPKKEKHKPLVIYSENDAEYHCHNWSESSPWNFLKKTRPLRLFPINTGGSSLCSSKSIKQLLLLTPVLPG